MVTAPLEADLRKPHRPRAGVLVICPSLVVEGGASLQGDSASGPTPGCASVQLAHAPARSHTGIAVQMKLWLLSASRLDPRAPGVPLPQYLPEQRWPNRYTELHTSAAST